MPYNINKTVLLVGAGGMAQEYSRVLSTLGIAHDVVGRGKKSASVFEKQTKKRVSRGGLSEFLGRKGIGNYSHAIVAVNVDQLAPAVNLLLDEGIKDILVEKPAGLNGKEIRAVATKAKKRRARIWVAYNRRFYASVIKAMEIIRKDGGVSSFNFEFTEWPHVIEKMDFLPEIKKNWFLGNSTHVVDLAFFLGGTPREIICYSSGGLEWHPSGSIYAGAGVGKNGALFSYQANWEAPGRWGVEILTKKHRLIFRPLEKLQLQRLGSVAVEYVDIDDKLDMDFKPGFYRQVEAFVSNNTGDLCTIEEQAERVELFYCMANYR